MKSNDENHSFISILTSRVSTQSRRIIREKLITINPYIYLLPAGLVLLIFQFYPLGRTLYISFFKWNLGGINPEFIGLDNYKFMFRTPQFWNALKNTLLYIGVIGPCSMLLGLGLAMLINKVRHLRTLWRTVYFLPYGATLVGIGYVWNVMYHPQIGIINKVLELFGFSGKAWLSDPEVALPALMVIGGWQIFGYSMVLFMAGLSNIPHSQYEAAEIDGAGPVQRFFHVTLPILSPTTLLVLITTSIILFQVFDTVQVLTDGGPARSTEVLALLIWREAFQYFRAGYAAALSYVMFAVILAFTIFQLIVSGRRVHYQ